MIKKLEAWIKRLIAEVLADEVKAQADFRQFVEDALHSAGLDIAYISTDLSTLKDHVTTETDKVAAAAVSVKDEFVSELHRVTRAVEGGSHILTLKDEPSHWKADEQTKQSDTTLQKTVR